MDAIVRVAGVADEEVVVALWQTCDLTTAYNDPAADFRLASSGSASCVLVAEETTGQIVGTAMVGHDGHRGWLYYVATNPNHRGKGIGRALINAGECWLRSHQIAKVQLMVREANAAVTPFYARLGFEETPRIIMAKWLTPPEADLPAL